MGPFLSTLTAVFTAAEESAEASAEAAPEVAASSGPSVISGEFWTADHLFILASEYGLPAIGAILVLFISYLVSSWLSRLVSNALRRSNVDETLSIFFGKAIRWLVLACAFIAILGSFGVSTASFAAVIAAIGFGMGLAMEGTLSNVAAGIMLLIFRPFKVGDYIAVSGEDGTVQEIDLFTTSLNTLDNRRVILPNKVVFGQTMQNFTANEVRRVDVAVGVAYGADIDETRKVLLEAAATVANQAEGHPASVYLVELGNSSVDWSVRIWTDPVNYWQVREDATEAAKKALDKAGITIPFPQLDVHFDRPIDGINS